MPHNSTMMALGSQVSLVTVGQLHVLCFLALTDIAAAVAVAIAAATVADIIIARIVEVAAGKLIELLLK
jgi:hypothetical protein